PHVPLRRRHHPGRDRAGGERGRRRTRRPDRDPRGAAAGRRAARGAGSDLMRIDASPLQLTPQARPDAARVEHVARQLEGQFAQMLVKSMRDASFGDALFPGENQTFRDMYDQQLAQALTSGKGLGLAPMIARQLGRQSGLDEAGTAPALDTRLDGRPGPTRAAAAALAYGRPAASALALNPEADRALDLIAGCDATTTTTSPM